MVIPHDQNLKKVPIDLVEALGGTPLTYLIPTHHITSLTGFKDTRIPTSYSLNYPTLPEDASTYHLRQALKHELQSDFKNFDVKFRTVQDPPTVNEPIDTEDTLLGCLNYFPEELIKSVPLINREDIFREGLQEVLPSNVKPNYQTLEVPILPTNKHKLVPESPDKPVEFKKKKSDVIIQRDELSKVQVAKLVDLITKKIGLTDEEAEYEHSDLWDEWPDTGHYLSLHALQEIYVDLTSVIDQLLIGDVPVEVLSRVQTLSLKTIKAAFEMDWTSAGLPDQDACLQYAQHALLASSIVLMIFNCHADDKVLERDSYLIDVLSFIYLFVEDYLKRVTLIEGCDPRLLMGFVNLIVKTFHQFKVYIPDHQLSDTIITKIEYLTIMIIFNTWSRSLLFFKIESTSLLKCVFQFKRAQRSFILDEIMNNFESLHATKNSAREVTTYRNSSIQLFTYLIVNLVESVNISNKKINIRLPRSYPDRSTSEYKDLLESLSNISQDLIEVGTEMEDLVNSINSSLISRLIKNPTVYKAQIQLFVNDLLSIVSFPEYPSSEIILKNLMITLFSVPENQSTLVDSYILEIMGLVGSKMLEIRGIEELSITDNSLLKYKSQVYQYLLEFNKADKLKNSAFFFVTNWVNLIAGKDNENDDLTTNKAAETYYGIMIAFLNNSYNSVIPKLESIDLTNDKAEVAYREVLRHSGFIGLYDSFLHHLLRHVDYPKIKSRTRALKNLALLINKDLNLLRVPQIKQSITNKINDSSPLVRLAVLDIFEEYLIKKPEEFHDFYQSIILTNDKSTGVRLKSLKIAERFYSSTSDITVKAYLLDKIFRRLEDEEESVLDLSQNILLHILFLPSESDKENALKTKLLVNQSIEVVLSYVSKGEKNWLLFESFIFNMVLKETALNSPFHVKLIETISTIIDELFLFVIENMDTDVDVSKRLGLLSIFAKYDKQLISQDQLLSLQPYFTSDISGTDISLYSLMILRQTISNATSLRPEFLENCEASLLKRLTKLNSRELGQAVPSLVSISKLKNDNTKLANAAASCLSLISPYLTKASKGELQKFDPRCTRLIFLIGNFAKDCSFEKDRAIFDNKKLSLKKKESVLSFMIKNLIIFTRSNVDIQMRKIAVKNLISVCSLHPNLFLNEQILKIYDNEFESDRLEFQEVIIQGLLEFLETQEKISGKSNEKKKGKVGLDVDVFHGNTKTFENDGICASLVQRYVGAELRLCLLEDDAISYTAVKYLKFIVIKGFCNPRLCISTVIALQASANQFIRGVGLQLFKDLFERYESLIDTSFIQGFKEGAAYRSRLSPDILKENDSMISKFYVVIEDSKSAKKKFLNQLLRSFEFDVESITLEEVKTFHDYFLLMALNLAQCEFGYYDEVIALIDGLQKISISQGIALTKLLVAEADFLKDTSNINTEEQLRIGYLCAILLSFERIITCLRQSYKIFESNEKLHELKSQKTKIQKTGVKLVKFDPNNDDLSTLIANIRANI